MKRAVLTSLTALCLTACGDAADYHYSSGQLPATTVSFSPAEVDALHRAVFGVPADEIVQPDRHDPITRNLDILRSRLDPPRQSDVDRNIEILRRRIDPPSTAI